MRYVVIHIEDIFRRILSLLLTSLGLWFLFGFRPIILRRSCCSRTVVRSGVIAWFFQSRFLLALLFQGFVLLLLLLVLIKSGEAVLPDYVAIFLFGGFVRVGIKRVNTYALLVEGNYLKSARC